MPNKKRQLHVAQLIHCALFWIRSKLGKNILRLEKDNIAFFYFFIYSHLLNFHELCRLLGARFLLSVSRKFMSRGLIFTYFFPKFHKVLKNQTHRFLVNQRNQTGPISSVFVISNRFSLIFESMADTRTSLQSTRHTIEGVSSQVAGYTEAETSCQM
jgi:hypothetical protein